ncbi:MAG: hypothetical protein MMC23_005708 [Stictis urceolatum]|nr:hypothetical protein [Stictis urceolata]
MGPKIPVQHSQKHRVSSRRIEGVGAFGVQYSAKQNPAYSAREILENPSHILRPMMKERYAKRDMNTLWCSITANTMASKKVVRSSCVKRLRAALWIAMEERGFDIDGRRSLDRSVGLKGTLSLFAHEPTINLEFDKLREQMAFVVDHVLQNVQNHYPAPGSARRTSSRKILST